MQTSIKRMGNSAAVLLPKPVLAHLQVSAGDTLWSIASRVAPERDPRAEVATLQKLNHLASANLMPGQQLRTR